MITYQWEPFDKLLREPNINDLLRAHYAELAVLKDHLPLDPDYDLMLNAEKLGFFKVWSARDDKLLAGYIAFWIRPHVHYKSIPMAMDDLFFLMPEYRKGWTGIKMWKSALAALREHGVKLVIVHAKMHFEADRGGLGKLFQHLGFQPVDALYSRML